MRTLISPVRCARAPGAGSGAGRRPTGSSTPTRSAPRRSPAISSPRAPSRRRGSSTSPSARTAFSSRLSNASSRARPNDDPASVGDPVRVLGDLTLRGSIDLVERHARGAVRATDHKTGKARAADGVVIGGGQVLQPVLYALALERLLSEPVEGGRLYYCTADGGFQERVVPLDSESRASARTVLDVVGRALADGFLPAAPVAGACRWCDYRPACGPHAEPPVTRKPPERLADLARLRALR